MGDHGPFSVFVHNTGLTKEPQHRQNHVGILKESLFSHNSYRYFRTFGRYVSLLS